MSRLKEVSDWGLTDLLAEARPALLLGLVEATSRGHDAVRLVAQRLTAFFPDCLHARFLDVDENPSIAATLGIRDLPALILYRQGAEWARWEGAVDYRSVFSSVERLMGSFGEPD
jgi:hypothetical protein